MGLYAIERQQGLIKRCLYQMTIDHRRLYASVITYEPLINSEVPLAHGCAVFFHQHKRLKIQETRDRIGRFRALIMQGTACIRNLLSK